MTARSGEAGRPKEPSQRQSSRLITRDSAEGEQHGAQAGARGAAARTEEIRRRTATILIRRDVTASLGPRQTPVRPQMAERLGESSQTLGERRGVEVGVGV